MGLPSGARLDGDSNSGFGSRLIGVSVFALTADPSFDFERMSLINVDRILRHLRAGHDIVCRNREYERFLLPP
jgi:hypothetical protein